MIYVCHVCLTRCLELNHGTAVESFYNLTTREVRHHNKPIPITLSTLVHLEKFTIHGTVCFDRSIANEWTMTTPLPGIADLFKTSSSLKRISLVLFCFFIADSRQFPIGLANWAPLVQYLTKSSVSLFTLHIDTLGGNTCTAILTSLANCAELMKFVVKGVLVITPQIQGERKVSQYA